MINKRFILFSFSLVFSMIFFYIAKGSHLQKTCNIRLYSYYTNLAELAIIDSTYEKALIYYDSAFNNTHSPFFRDRFNELVCNAITGNYQKCRAGAIFLMEKGLNRNLIKDNQAFSTFLLSIYGKDILELDIKSTYDIVLRAKYDSIVYSDQLFRKNHPGSYMDYYGDTINKIDASNVKLMNELIKNYGWPTMDIIGTYDFGHPGFQTIIMHQSGSKNQVYNYSEDLYNAYENCLIEPDRVQFLIAHINYTNELNINYSGLTTIAYDTLNICNRDNYRSFPHKTGFVKIPDDKMAEINQERKTFGLESIGDLRRKVLYSQKDNRFHFKFMGGVQFFTISNIEDYNHLSKNLIENY
ncbi:MAG: hypothetical protein FD170_2688 [Bacteroidetes bacterium]|nr:MAG: hypothetical protein FD170_2688 [Bacteroidota bacterium]